MDLKDIYQKLAKALEEKIFGQEELIEDVLCTLFAKGHILLTGVPGLAKTTLVRVLAEAVQLEFRRVQFTPDLLPGDIIGSELLQVDSDSGKRTLEFSEGPVFTNLLLADEINRASPRTQSALLEAMQERSCTIAGQRYSLPDPFMVLATQNPLESEGTFVLPEAQLDRFLLHSLVNYPSREAELRILSEHGLSRLVGEQQGDLSEVIVAGDQIREIQAEVLKVKISEDLLSVVTDLVRLTRPESQGDQLVSENILYGAGPRAGIALVSVAKAHALLHGNQEVRWENIKRFIPAVFRHRIKTNLAARRNGIDEEKIIKMLVDQIEAKANAAIKL